MNYQSLTAMQVQLLDAVIAQAGNGATSVESMIADNFSWFCPKDIREVTGWSKEQCAGVISGALEAGLVTEEERNDFSVPIEVWEMLAEAGHEVKS